ncbi:ribosomal protein L4 [Aaosphaeria arxii CBS 175.79]|uniref:Large ribosomal subunit protein uL4m n=1 Tax=Aaosphaeria arxii CBS 175.79 TaxID=1450172 RepID=A0A6A5XQ49_9PLEO|nr:ribosomal protein L4 [Aaosphaeria arxii CBS 175.79]KAF2014850.1 ribosomal protein L4 [Aaosphaeria arxii CBS 175.79]
MASARLLLPVRSTGSPWSCMPSHKGINSKPLTATFSRTISTSPSPLASVSTTSSTKSETFVPLTPFGQQTVHATIHHFPSLEPLHLEEYPANHLNLPTRRDILHRAVIFEGDASRRGTASTKWRDEVRGSSRKVRPQKGTGAARLGDRRSPMLKGGGVAFGPKPRDFSTELQKKVYDLAFRTALSYRFRRGELIIVDNALELESPSSELLKAIFNAHGWWGKSSGSSLLITVKDRPLLEMTLAQTPLKGQALLWDEVDVKDLLGQGRVVIEKGALQMLLLKHQDDLPKQPRSPASTLNRVTEELPEVLGWSEFSRLEVAALEEEPEEQLRLKSRLYHAVADKRQTQAATKPEPEATRLHLSSLEAREEAYKAQAEAITEHFDLKRQSSEKEKLAGLKDANGPEYLQLLRESSFLDALAMHHQTKKMSYEAKAAFTRGDALDLRGDGASAYSWREYAEVLKAEADDLRTEIENTLTGADMSSATDEELKKFKSLLAYTQRKKTGYALSQENASGEGEQVSV